MLVDARIVLVVSCVSATYCFPYGKVFSFHFRRIIC